MSWCSVLGFDELWCGLVHYGVVLSIKVLYGVMWYGALYGVMWYGALWCSLVHNGLVWCILVGFGAL